MIDYVIDNEFFVGSQYGSLGMTNKYYKDGYWYKQNFNGTEGHSEAVCSHLLSCSNVTDYVCYEECLINGLPGCRSKSFTNEGETVVTFHRLYKMITGGELKNRVSSFDTPKERIAFVIQFIKQYTGVDCRSYLNKMLYFDMLTLDVDRHFHNLSLIQTEEGFREAPMFDFGASFFSLKHVFPDKMPLDEKFKKMTPQPFSRDFEEQAHLLGECEIKIDYEKVQSYVLDFLREDKKNSEELCELIINQLERYRRDFAL
ncbi:MAG: hypothetical protein LUG93_15745 [Lachnospiraceae bacterium]|nr:hypothetical protein [Lachnospiraceae bacterium]